MLIRVTLINKGTKGYSAVTYIEFLGADISKDDRRYADGGSYLEVVEILLTWGLVAIMTRSSVDLEVDLSLSWTSSTRWHLALGCETFEIGVMEGDCEDSLSIHGGCPQCQLLRKQSLCSSKLGRRTGLIPFLLTNCALVLTCACTIRAGMASSDWLTAVWPHVAPQMNWRCIANP